MDSLKITKHEWLLLYRLIYDAFPTRVDDQDSVEDRSALLRTLNRMAGLDGYWF